MKTLVLELACHDLGDNGWIHAYVPLYNNLIQDLDASEVFANQHNVIVQIPVPAYIDWSCERDVDEFEFVDEDVEDDDMILFFVEPNNFRAEFVDLMQEGAQTKVYNYYSYELGPWSGLKQLMEVKYENVNR